jgi:hypothetical protein
MATNGATTQCLGKERFDTREHAGLAAAAQAKVAGKPIRSFFCSLCNGYHLTSRRGRGSR